MRVDMEVDAGRLTHTISRALNNEPFCIVCEWDADPVVSALLMSLPRELKARPRVRLVEYYTNV